MASLGEQARVAVAQALGDRAQAAPPLLVGLELGGGRVGEDGRDDGGSDRLAGGLGERAAEVDPEGSGGHVLGAAQEEAVGLDQSPVVVQDEHAGGGIGEQLVEERGP